MPTVTVQEFFLAAYDEHADAIFRYCIAHVGDRERAKDLTQETFVRVWKYLAKGARIEKIRPFLYRTASNAIIDQSRKQQSVSLDELTEQGFDATDTATPIAVLAEAGRAQHLMQQLDPRHRDILVMRYVNELQLYEIADVLGESENVTSVRIHRALNKLKELMGINT
jgi:RNA polymerase sigma-70 factor (ECF subfamily)